MMKKSLFSIITPWIWRGVALLLAIYFFVAVVAGIPFFHLTTAGTPDDDDLSGIFWKYEYHPNVGNPENVSKTGHIETQSQTISLGNVARSSFVGYSFDIGGSFKGSSILVAGQEITLSPHTFCETALYLRTDDLIVRGEIADCNDVWVIGLKKPTCLSENCKISYSRSYSTPFLPWIDTGESPLGMIILTFIPILISLLLSCFLPGVFSASPKTVFSYGWRAKLILCLVGLILHISPAALFYLTGNFLTLLLPWLTPIISIPALSVWVASFKNKKFAPVVAAAIMALCLYQPLANLICLFATVIAWGYFAHGVCRFFGRFRKAKSEAV